MGNFIVGMINKIIAAIGSLITGFLDLLPNSPFAVAQTNDNFILDVALPTLNWILPIQEIIIILGVVASATVLWFAISIPLRWIKAVQ